MGIGVLLLVRVLLSTLVAYFDTHDPQAVKDASASNDKLIDLFNRIERFFRRLEIYTGIPPTAAMTNMIIDIMVEVLDVIAVITKEAKRGRFSELMSGAKHTTLV